MHRLKPHNHGRRRGAALGLVVILMLLLSISSLTLMQVGRDARLRAVDSSADIAAWYAAEAGIERTLYRMNQAITTGNWTNDAVQPFDAETLTGANADYTVTIDGSPTVDYTVTSIGHSGGATRTIRATIRLTGPFSSNYAILSRQNVDLKSKSTVKGFDSSDPMLRDLWADIGTLSSDKSSITLKHGTEVYGDVYVGPGSNPEDVITFNDRSDIRGELFSLLTVPTLDPILPPALPGGDRGKLSVKKDPLVLTSHDSGVYSSIDIDNKGTLKINEDCVLVVTGDISIGNDAQIIVDKNASLTVYFEQDIKADNAAGINNESHIPAQLKFYGTGTRQKIDLKTDSTLFGAIYAPNAAVTLNNKGHVYGAVIADNFELKNNGNIYYDKALQNIKITDEGIRFTVVRWEEG